MKAMQDTISTLRKLKDFGTRLAIDDFEIGYSPLSYLKRFSLDYPKIERPFIDGPSKDPEDNVIASNINRLGRP